MSVPWIGHGNVSFKRSLEAAYFGVVVAITLAFAAIGWFATNRVAICLGCVAICASALVAGIFLCRLLSRPIQLLEKNLLRLQLLDLDGGGGGRSHITEVRHMRSAIDDMRRLLRSFTRYVPHDVVAGHVRSHTEAEIGAERRELSIFFSDISGFTSICELMPPERLVEDLKAYFQGLTEIIIAEQGTIDKYIGDAIMAFWNAPERQQDHALHACRAALRCIRYCYGVSREWERNGLPPLRTRIGLNTGDVVVGNVGYEKRLNYTIMGDNVNLTSRLQGLNKYYGTEILITESTYVQVRSVVAARLVDVVVVKGKTQGVPVYEILGEYEGLDSEVREFIQTYDQGMRCYFGRDWRGGAERFQAALTLNPNDRPSAIMLDRCRKFTQAPPPADWTGVIVMREK